MGSVGGKTGSVGKMGCVGGKKVEELRRMREGGGSGSYSVASNSSEYILPFSSFPPLTLDTHHLKSWRLMETS